MEEEGDLAVVTLDMVGGVDGVTFQVGQLKEWLLSKPSMAYGRVGQ